MNDYKDFKVGTRVRVTRAGFEGLPLGAETEINGFDGPFLLTKAGVPLRPDEMEILSPTIKKGDLVRVVRDVYPTLPEGSVHRIEDTSSGDQLFIRLGRSLYRFHPTEIEPANWEWGGGQAVQHVLTKSLGVIVGTPHNQAIQVAWVGRKSRAWEPLWNLIPVEIAVNGVGA